MTTKLRVSKVEQWISEIDANSNEYDSLLAENFEYLIDNIEVVAEGDIDPEELPELDTIEKSLILLCTLYGKCLTTSLTRLYEVSCNETFIGVYGTKKNAENRADGLDEGEVTPHIIHGYSKQIISDVFASLYQSKSEAFTLCHTLLTEVEDTRARLRDELEESIDEVESVPLGVIVESIVMNTLSETPTNIELITIRSVIFGILLELSTMTLHGEFDGNNLQRIHRYEGQSDHQWLELLVIDEFESISIPK